MNIKYVLEARFGSYGWMPLGERSEFDTYEEAKVEFEARRRAFPESGVRVIKYESEIVLINS